MQRRQDHEDCVGPFLRSTPADKLGLVGQGKPLMQAGAHVSLAKTLNPLTLKPETLFAEFRMSEVPHTRYVNLQQKTPLNNF